MNLSINQLGRLMFGKVCSSVGLLFHLYCTTSATSLAFLLDSIFFFFLPTTAELTQLLSNSQILLLIHKAKSNVFILKVIQNLGCHLQHGGQERGGCGWRELGQEHKEKLVLLYFPVSQVPLPCLPAHWQTFPKLPPRLKNTLSVLFTRVTRWHFIFISSP